MDIVDYHRPNLLLLGGDGETATNENEFYELLKKVIVLTIYGNYENMSVLTKLYNVKTSEYLPVLIEDGRIYEISGLKVAGINGIYLVRRR